MAPSRAPRDVISELLGSPQGAAKSADLEFSGGDLAGGFPVVQSRWQRRHRKRGRTFDRWG